MGEHFFFHSQESRENMVTTINGRAIRKVMGGGAKIKIEQGKQKKNSSTKKVKKKFMQRLFNKENCKFCTCGPKFGKYIPYNCCRRQHTNLDN
jgi:hypothetical protein